MKFWSWLRAAFGSRPCEKCGRPSDGMYMVAVRRNVPSGRIPALDPSTTFRVKQLVRLCRDCLREFDHDEN